MRPLSVQTESGKIGSLAVQILDLERFFANG